MCIRDRFEHRDQCLHLHVTLVPYLTTSGEIKTKPTQHSVKELREVGIHPDIIVCRTDRPLSSSIKKKIALFCDVSQESVITAVDASSIYEVPLLLENERLDQVVVSKLGLKKQTPDLKEWKAYVDILHQEDKPSITIALVGKYNSLSLSLIHI